MASEKYRYFPRIDTRKEEILKDLESRLKEFIQQLPSEECRPIISNLSTGHPNISKELISRYIIMTREEIEKMLDEVIDSEADKDDIIHPDAELAVENITTALLENAEALIMKGDLVKATEIACAIITVIEKRMERVYDEGWTFQCIVKEAFDFLNHISQLPFSKEIADKLISASTIAFETRDEDYCYYDDEWKEVINKLKKP